MQHPTGWEVAGSAFVGALLFNVGVFLLMCMGCVMVSFVWAQRRVKPMEEALIECYSPVAVFTAASVLLPTITLTSIFAAMLSTATTATFLSLTVFDVLVNALFLYCAWSSVRISMTCPFSHVVDNDKEPHLVPTSFLQRCIRKMEDWDTPECEWDV
eukprot:PhF_6_TR6111/c1_g4_i4/m.9014